MPVVLISPIKSGLAYCFVSAGLPGAIREWQKSVIFQLVGIERNLPLTARALIGNSVGLQAVIHLGNLIHYRRRYDRAAVTNRIPRQIQLLGGPVIASIK